MKKLLKLMIASLLVLSTLTACSTPADSDTAVESVELTGTAEGYHGELTVKVVMDDTTISSVEVVSHTETEGVGTNAIDKMPGEMVANQTIEVDSVAGASVSSAAIKEAVKAALTSGGYDVAEYSKTVDATVEKTDEVMDADIVVVGTGLSGLMSAIKSAESGAKVVMLEKMSTPGGATALSGGNISAVGTKAQEVAGITDSVEEALVDWKDNQSDFSDPSGKYPNYDYCEDVLEMSSDVVNSIMDYGYPYEIAGDNGDSFALDRRHYNPELKGADLVEFLVGVAEDNGVEIVFETRANEVVLENGVVTGIKAEGKDSNLTVNASAVIMATGGFANSQEMTDRFAPQSKAFTSYQTGAVSSTGDGIAMCENAGAQLTEGPWYIIGPGLNPVSKDLAKLEGKGMHINVTIDGERVAPETGLPRKMYPYLIESGSPSFFIVFDSSEPFKDHIAVVEADTKNADEYFKADTIEELAEMTGMNEENLLKTISEYNAGNDPFGKKAELMNPIATGPFYAAKGYPCNQNSFGGPEIDENQAVLNADYEPIPGLYAAGELVFRHYFLRANMSAASLLVASVTGSNAGESAVEYINQK